MNLELKNIEILEYVCLLITICLSALRDLWQRPSSASETLSAPVMRPPSKKECLEGRSFTVSGLTPTPKTASPPKTLNGGRGAMPASWGRLQKRAKSYDNAEIRTAHANPCNTLIMTRVMEHRNRFLASLWPCRPEVTDRPDLRSTCRIAGMASH